MPSRTSTPASTSTPPLDISISGSSLTLHPSISDQPSSTTSSTSHDTEPPAIEHGPHFRTAPLDYLRRLGLHVSGADWRAYNNYIGQDVFYDGFSEQMQDAVMASPLLRTKIDELAARRVDVEIAEGVLREKEEKRRRRDELVCQLREVAEKMTSEMICKMESKLFIRGAYYLVTQLMTRSYNQGIHVSSEEVLRLRAVAEEAEKKKQSIIFLPSHRSHIDYISLQVICFRLGLSLPTVIAGDNLNFPLIGDFLQHAGAMWIRRSFGDDQLYVTLVQAYLDTLLQKGLNVECFIEGGRSRLGKLLPPKFGILSFLLDSVLSGRVDDAIICPVSTQYDKVIEVDSYVGELLGTPKPKENLLGFLNASSVLSLKLGRVDVRFHEPWSLKSFIQAQQARLTTLSAEQQAALQKAYNKNMRIRLLRTLGYKVLSDINAVSVVMPTSLIGTVLLTSHSRGIGKSELIRRVEWLSERVRAQGGRVAHFAGQSVTTVVGRGLEVLGPKLVAVQKNLAEETYSAVDAFQLSFYRNMVIHLFVSPALVAAALWSHVRGKRAEEEQSLSLGVMRGKVLFLSKLFRGEFIYATAGLVENLEDTIKTLETDNVLSVHRGEDHSEAHVELTQLEHERNMENFSFYCFLIWPYLETYWLGALSLLMLTPPSGKTPAWIDSKALLTYAQLLGKTLFAQGDLSYFEAVNKETLKNALARFEEEGILVVRKPPKGSSQAQMARLADAWQPSREHDTGRLARSGKLWDSCAELGAYRQEKTVGRVLRVVDIVAKSLWKEGQVQVGTVHVDDSAKAML